MKKCFVIIFCMLNLSLTNIIAKEQLYNAYSIHYSTYMKLYITPSNGENLTKEECINVAEDELKNALDEKKIDKCKKLSNNSYICPSEGFPYRIFCFPVEMDNNPNNKEIIDFINTSDKKNNQEKANKLFPFD